MLVHQNSDFLIDKSGYENSMSAKLKSETPKILTKVI